jgi:hypothetical protein
MPGVRTRVLLSLFVVWHLLVSAGSVLKRNPVGAAIREVTGPWERLLGVYQRWPMFVSPGAVTPILQLVGIDAEGGERVLPFLPGEPDPDGVIWVYERRDKLMRNAMTEKNDGLQASLVRYACDSDASVVAVRLDRVARRSPAPFDPDPGPRASWPVNVRTLHRWNCPEAK